jgi:hypothetical protein
MRSVGKVEVLTRLESSLLHHTTVDQYAIYKIAINSKCL